MSDCRNMAAGNDSSSICTTYSTVSCPEDNQPRPSFLPATEESRGISSCLNSAEWPLRRYGRFMPGGLGPASGSWKVLESNEESGFLVLTIVISGHFFISRGKDVLEGFSLIDASQWLKIVRNADCMLFGSKSKSKHRMFRVQFMGDSKSQSEENCCNCVQKLADYVPVQVIDAGRQELLQVHSLLPDDQSQDAEQNELMPHTVENPPSERGRVSVAELAQYMMSSNVELPLAYRHSMWNAEDLSSFIRLCLLDQSFPAFVEEVEKQLKKITNSQEAKC
ncbi:meiotic recombination protein REC114 isoform X2 [Sceloporus undulatus]|uniref:meiotic recombination protein REC114 isoform X2 n=1 Tax=Sceloporus undulatus TaxID=8520 RepID=UPI001C4A80CA|nr:meiotic recombination protein REC114 isoform X2 [Sceloporus undulatus]